MTVSSPWQASLSLAYDRPPGDRTRLTRCLVQAPLKVQRPFYRPGSPQCQTWLLHTGGGMVAGDRLNYDITLGEGSHVLLTTATASKIYRSPGPWSEQTFQITLADQAALHWCPQETILFDQARYHQTVQIHLAPTASFCGWEILRLGRTARGETFSAGHWRSHWDIWQGNTLIWAERQQAIGSADLFHSPNALGGHPVLATYLDLRRPFTPIDLTQARQYTPAYLPPTAQIGFTLTATKGLLARYRGPSSEAIKALWTHLHHTLTCPPNSSEKNPTHTV